jgi:hypothetical protein
VTLLLIWLAMAIIVEAVTEIIVDGDIFFRLRNFLNKINPGFLGKLFTCGYCMSVWISASIAWVLPGHIIEYYFLDLAFKIFLLHRISNVLHGLINRIVWRVPVEIVVTHVHTKEEIGDSNVQTTDGAGG